MKKDTYLLLKEALELIKKYGEVAIDKNYVLEVQDIYYLQTILNEVKFMLKNF